jgi:hypothetical protein
VRTAATTAGELVWPRVYATRGELQQTIQHIPLAQPAVCCTGFGRNRLRPRERGAGDRPVATSSRLQSAAKE